MEKIVAKNLVKKFGDKVAVNDVSLTVHSGEIFGFLGPNGAGKTTTIRLLAGALDTDEGEIYICKNPAPESEDYSQNTPIMMNYENDYIEIKSLIGVVPEEPPMFKSIRGNEFIRFIASVYNCDEDIFQRLNELCELLHIDFLDEFIDNYSHGMKQKLMLVSVLMRRPEIMFLDEPTTGLDPYSARGLKLLLRRMADNGSAIFLTTHILEIAEKMCDRLTVISDGSVVASGNIEQLRAKAGTEGDLEQIFLQLTGADENEIQRLVDEL
ncbi:ABC transporter ATP-binding protein [bacterium]|nr:MAG: ABC transporter ATP-binding protein [bacterium]